MTPRHIFGLHSCARAPFLSVCLVILSALLPLRSAGKSFSFVNDSGCTVSVQYYYRVIFCGGGYYGWFPQYGPCGNTISPYHSGKLCVPMDCIGGQEVDDVLIVWIYDDGGLNDTNSYEFPLSTYGSDVTVYLNCNGIERVSSKAFDDKDFPPDPDCKGMPVWQVTEPFISLWLLDEPLSYQPALGPRISLKLNYKQRESTAGLDPTVFSVGRNWNFSWLSYVASGMNPNGATPSSSYPYTDVFFAGGGKTTFQGTVSGGVTTYAPDYLTNTKLSTNSNSGFTVLYPDGRQDVFGFMVTNSDGTFRKAMLTERRDKTGQKTTLYYAAYAPTNPIVRLLSVVDGDGRTNSVSYVTTNAYSTNLISQVSDPFGRTVSLMYDTNGFLTNIVDPANLSSSIAYDFEGRANNLITPYGTNTFQFTENSGTNLPPVGRSVRVIQPDGSCQLFLYTNGAPGVPNSYSNVPATSPFTNTLETTSLDQRNTFHWNSAQYASLSTTNLSVLSAADFAKAHLRHWLLSSTNALGTTLSLERAPSPDGATAGQVTWYDYAGKTNNAYEGSQVEPLVAALVLPDSTTRFTRSDRNANGLPTNEISTYSAFGSVALRTNTFTYGTNGIDLLAVTNALNVQLFSNAYNSYHQVVTNVDALGQLTVLLYNTNQQLASITRPSGIVTTNVYFASGTASNFLNTTIDYAVISGTPIYYRTNSFTWNNDLVSTHTDPMGLTVTNTWDNLQRLRRLDFPDQTFVTNVFLNLDLVQVIDRMGYSNSFGFDSLRRLVTATDANGVVTRYGYCSCGSLNAVTNAFGTSLQNVTTFAWDLQGNKLQSVGADLYTVTYNYNALGQVTNVYDGLTSVTNWYNNQGLLITSSNAVGRVAAATYDILDRTTNGVDVNSVTVTNTFDNLNRLLTRGYPDGGVERYVYTLNVAGATSYTNQLGTNVVNFMYDPLDRKTAEVYPGIATNSFGYDAVNHLLTFTDGNNHTTTWTFDPYGRMVTKADATGTIILTNAYDPDNRLTNRWTIAKTNTIYGYDPLGNLTSVQYPVSHGINYYYDVLDRLTNMVDAVGSSYYSYTVAGQLASEDGPWTDDTVNYTYSTASRLRTGLSLLQPNASAWAQSYNFDSAERLQSLNSPAGSFLYGYDPIHHGKVNSLGIPNGAYITNSFDSLAQLSGTVLKNSTNGVLNSHQYAYNVARQRTYLTNTAGDFRNYLYDNVGQLTNCFAREANNAARLNEYLAYTYDAAGNLKTRYIFQTTETFGLNSVNQLTNQTRSGSSFTVAGTTTSSATNVLLTANGGWPYSVTPYSDNTWGVGVALNNGTNTFVAVALDALGRTDTNTVTCYLPVTNLFSYDGNGNLLSDGNRNFAYDDENQLTSVWATNSWRSDFVYDGKMRRRIRREYTWSSGSWLQTNEVHYIYDGNLVVQERDANNVPSLSYTRGWDLSGRLQGAGGVGGLLAMSKGSGVFSQHSFYHADGNGNITCLVNTNQAIVARYLYDPFGNILSKAGSLADVNLYRFSSKEFHSASGLTYYQRRFYDPILGRWLNQDPIAETGGWNLYRFVNNSPLDFVDPLGLTEADDVAHGFRYTAYSMPTRPRPDGVRDGYIDNFGNWAPDFCMSCHDRTPTSCFLKQQSLLANQLDWKVLSYEVVLPFLTPAVAESYFQDILEMPTLVDLAAEGPVTIGDILAGHSSDTMIHLTTATEDELATATFPNFTPPHTTPGVFQGSSWVQLGDVSHMTLPEYQELVVGPSAAGYGSDVTAFVTHPPSSVFTPVNVPNLGGVQEFINGAVVKPGTYVPLPGKP